MLNRDQTSHFIPRNLVRSFIRSGAVLIFLFAVLLQFQTLGGAPLRNSNLAALPIGFEPNVGQTAISVSYLARGAGYTVFLRPREAVLSLRKVTSAECEPAAAPSHRKTTDCESNRTATVTMKFRRASRGASMAGEAPLPSTSNYFRGREPFSWRRGIPNYEHVRYSGIYPGVDLIYYGNGRRLEYDFVVRPGADPRRIAFSLTGVNNIRMDPTGDLRLETAGGILHQRKPVVYQERHGRRTEIAGDYRVGPANMVSFEVGPYDRSLPLVIDPILDYSTYLGGTGQDTGFAIAADSAGNAYIAGTTQSMDFPTTSGVAQQNPKPPEIPGDAFVCKLNPSGTGLVYSTYLSGARTDAAYGIALDSSGAVYVTGATQSQDFPVTAGAFQTSFGNVGDASTDAFVTKLDPKGDLVYSTYLGGSANDAAYAIAVDSSGAGVVTGETESPEFPSTPNVFAIMCGGLNYDAFVTKLNPDGKGLAYSGFLCGSAADRGLTIALDSSGNAYVGGETSSQDFSTTSGVLKNSTDGLSREGFVAKINPAGTSLLYSTFLGGSSDDTVRGIAVDAQGSSYVAGSTLSTDFPVTPGAFQPQQGDGGAAEDAFIAKLDPAAKTLVYSTFLGGSNFDSANGIAIDSAGNAYVVGETHSPDFPSTPTPCQPGYKGGADAFAAKLSASGATLAYSVLLGGQGTERGFGIAVDSSGAAYVTGQTLSANFPTAAAAFRTAYNHGYQGASDAFVARILDAPDPALPCIAVGGILNGASFLPGPLSPGEIISIFGAGIGPNPLVPLQVNGNLLATSLADTQVFFDGEAAPLIFVLDNQLSAIVPYTVFGKQSTQIQVQYQGRSTPVVTMPVAVSASGIFSRSQSGEGPGAVLNQNSSVNSPQNPAAKNSVVVVFATGEGQTNPSGVSGQINPGALPLPKPQQQVTAKVGGLNATVEYAGAAPALVAGVLQVNVRLPAQTPSGNAVPIELKIGSNTSQPGLTIAIK